MPTMLNCPKCDTPNPSDASNCTNCHINLTYAFEHADIWKPNVQAQAIADARQAIGKLAAEMTITTTPTIQGREISAYLGIVSSVVVLGTGFMSELRASISDIAGGRSSAFQLKLSEATRQALTEIRTQAAHEGANAVIGLDLDYMITDNNMFVVTANGTAVLTTLQSHLPK